jgi:hypothetical protein
MKVRCINKHGWYYTKSILWGIVKYNRYNSNGPKYNDVVTVVGEEWHEGIQFYKLKEWPGEEDVYQSNQFEPIEEDSVQQVTYTKIKESNPVSIN